MDIGETGKFSPATIKLNQELVIEGPVVSSPDGLLLLHDGRANEVVDAHFDSARLGEQTIEDLPYKLPVTPMRIDYVLAEASQKPASGGPCRTFIHIKAKDGVPPSGLHFYQLAAGPNGNRQLEMKVDGKELIVDLVTDTPPGVTIETEGCRKFLRPGGFRDWPVPTTLPVTVIAAAGSSFRFIFRPLDKNIPLFDGDQLALFAPFDLGPPKTAPNDPAPFQARVVSVKTLQSSDSIPPPLLSVQSADGGPLLIVSDLRVGADELQINVAGVGAMKINGQVQTVNFREALARLGPLPQALMVALDAALIAWFIRILSSRGTRRRKNSTNA
jgi:hypothetical protein